MENISSLKHIIGESAKVSVIVHTHPDGDALGSGAAMTAYLRERVGKDVRMIIPDSAPGTVDFIIEGLDVLDASKDPAAAQERISSSDLILILDLNALHRTEQLAGLIAASPATKVLIDHHLNPETAPFELLFSEPERSSTCELLYFILKELEGGSIGTIPLRSLEAMMAGMTTDTNNFANSVIPSTLQMASELLEAGVDRDAIIDKIYHSDREQRIFAFADMVSNHLTILPSGISYMIMTEEMQSAYGLLEGETESLVNIPLNIERVRMSIFIREEGGLFRVSIRSKRGISAQHMARDFFHGGGHELAAGGKIFWPDDIPSKDAAATYLEEIAARFLRNETTN
ncbi:MAG: DHH family phosphoesterase [Bacteroidales bacterium]|nr:DHH family phosphoesterase [Bacteroidales bacterium]